MANLKNHYQVLQVDPSAEPEVISAAYKRLALKYHPDTNPAPEAKSRMQALNEAYAVLADADARRQYDLTLSSGRSAPPAPDPVPPERAVKTYNPADIALGRTFMVSFVVIAGGLFFLLRGVARSPIIILAILLIAGIISFTIAFRIDDAIHRFKNS